MGLKSRDHTILLKNFSFLTILRGLNVAVKFFLAAYLIRVLGSITYGVLTWVDAIIQYGLIIINFGFNIYAAKYVVQYKDDCTTLNRITSSIFIIKFAFFLLSLVTVTLLGYFSLFESYHQLMILMIFMGLGEVFFPIWYFQGVEKLQYATYITVFSRVVLVVSTICLVTTQDDLIMYIVLLIFSNLCMGGLGYYTLKKHYNFRFTPVSLLLLKQILNDAYLFFLGLFLSLTFNLLTVFLIGVYYTMAYVSGFDIALKIVLVFIIPFDIFQQALYPTITRTKNKILLKKIVWLSLLIGCFFSVLLYVFSEQLITLFGGKDLVAFDNVLKTLAIIPPIVAVTFILGTCTLVAFGYQKEFNKSLIISSFVFIIAVIILRGLELLTFWNLIYLRVFSDLVLMLLRVYYVRINKILL